MTTPAPFTTKDVAEALGVEAKALRVFLRSPGAEGTFTREGKSYVFAMANVTAIKKAYLAWTKERATTKAEKEKAKALAMAAVVEETAEAVKAS